MLCAVNEPLVKVLHLVDGNKPVMGYLYEAMVRAKEAIHIYYEDKGDGGCEKRLLIWKVIDEQRDKTFHSPHSCCKHLPQPRVLILM